MSILSCEAKPEDALIGKSDTVAIENGCTHERLTHHQEPKTLWGKCTTNSKSSRRSVPPTIILFSAASTFFSADGKILPLFLIQDSDLQSGFVGEGPADGPRPIGERGGKHQKDSPVLLAACCSGRTFPWFSSHRKSGGWIAMFTFHLFVKSMFFKIFVVDVQYNVSIIK
ncbi:hypothetical protein CDAR_567901 [Caerostris darwini]|uniref:Uncharacterized protein n=1 Tax=Caerostris darwini TaxID=1538125 RepID=A0AAV4SKK5_9ARAC|nr:hypothetical protein CDAR_567901 [Caerostris darwini]